MFNLSGAKEERKGTEITENSMANAETEEDDISFVKSHINEYGGRRISILKQKKGKNPNNFFRDTLSPSNFKPK